MATRGRYGAAVATDRGVGGGSGVDSRPRRPDHLPHREPRAGLDGGSSRRHAAPRVHRDSHRRRRRPRCGCDDLGADRLRPAPRCTQDVVREERRGHRYPCCRRRSGRVRDRRRRAPRPRTTDDRLSAPTLRTRDSEHVVPGFRLRRHHATRELLDLPRLRSRSHRRRLAGVGTRRTPRHLRRLVRRSARRTTRRGASD